MKRRWTLAFLAATGLAGAVAAVAGESVVLFPLQRGSRDAGAAAAVVEQALYDGLRELGPVADPSATRNALRRLRLRSPERAGADQLRRLGGELGAAWLFAAALHDAPSGQVPDLSISARLYDAATGEMVWAGFAAASGLDSRTVLGLGVRDRVEALAPVPVRRLLAASPLASSPPSGRVPPAARTATRSSPMALVPFTAYVEEDALAAAVAATEATRAALYPGTARLASPECVEEALHTQQSRAWGELSATARTAIRAACGVDLLVTGSVERWEIGGPAIEPRPVVALALRLLDAASGRILWMGSREATGWDGQSLFGLGRIHSRGALLERLLSRLTRDLLQAGAEFSPAAPDAVQLAQNVPPAEPPGPGTQLQGTQLEVPEPRPEPLVAADADSAGRAEIAPTEVIVAAPTEPQPDLETRIDSGLEPGSRPKPETESETDPEPEPAPVPVPVPVPGPELVDEPADQIAEAPEPALEATPAAAAGLVEGARAWLGRGVRYDPSYVEMSYPGGDPPADRGAAVDLVVRAFRKIGVDLQQAVHEDIAGNRSVYGYEGREPDTNVSHRRIRNLIVFLARNAQAVKADDYRAGDVVVWDTDGGGSGDHVGIVSSGLTAGGRPPVIHHRRPGGEFAGTPSEDDSLRRWPIAAHFRWSATPDEAGEEPAIEPRRPAVIPEGAETPAAPEPEVVDEDRETPESARIGRPAATAALVEGARGWLGRGVRYDASYIEMDYPGGDPPSDRGAAVDLVVRAFRHAGLDLQQAVHEDILRDRSAYGYVDREPDTNVSHRRIRNLTVFLARNSKGVSAAEYRAGDVVLWDTDADGTADHVGIVSSDRAGSGRLLVIHHRRPEAGSAGEPIENDALNRWPIAAHFRNNTDLTATEEN